ncbi:MAG: hypothetical protein ABWY45_16450 [Mycobacterium sp.]
MDRVHVDLWDEIAVSMTAARAEGFEFSQPILDAGLQIISPAGATEVATPGLGGVVGLLFSDMMLFYLELRCRSRCCGTHSVGDRTASFGLHHVSALLPRHLPSIRPAGNACRTD